MTQNDRELRLFNGVVVADDDHLRAAFERGGQTVLLSPSHLSAFEPLHAMTVHKAQGSKVGTAAVLLPDPSSRLLSRELLYTAVTRAETEVIAVGSIDAVREATRGPASRATGLQTRLA